MPSCVQTRKLRGEPFCKKVPPRTPLQKLLSPARWVASAVGGSDPADKLWSFLTGCQGKLFCVKKLPLRPFKNSQLLKTLPAISVFRSCGKGAGNLTTIEIQPLPAQRQGLQIIGVFGEGCGEALFAKRPPRSLSTEFIGFAPNSRRRHSWILLLRLNS